MSEQLGLSTDVFDYAETLTDGALYVRHDPETGLRAVIAVDSTKRGPALGGCRCLEYENTQDALYDAVRLAKGMTYKAAITKLPLGGGKTVIMKPKQIKDEQAFFEAFGRMVNQLNGQYITAMDSGTSLEYMDYIATQTPYVASVSTVPEFPTGDPSPFTAQGVLRGIEAAVKHKLQRDDLQDIHLAMQGVGHVGYHLCRMLHERGAKITVCDPNQELVDKCITEFNATAVGLDEIFSVPCDIFAPCALGAILNDKTIERIEASIIAGCANNQLAEARHGQILHDRGVLYAPDYAINAGGLIYALAQYQRTSEQKAAEQTDKIYDTMLEIYERSAKENKPTGVIADTIALEILAE